MTDRERLRYNVEKNDRYRKNNPWASSLSNARKRCNYKGHALYRCYGGRGIKCLLTIAEVKSLWERDGAANMVRPSLDRKDNDLHYTFENCEFIELTENISKANAHRALFPPKTKAQVRAYFASMTKPPPYVDPQYGPDSEE